MHYFSQFRKKLASISETTLNDYQLDRANDWGYDKFNEVDEDTHKKIRDIFGGA